MTTEVLLFEALPADLRESIERGAARCLCPMCSGGRTGELSLDVRQSEDAVMRLKCYRASCGWYAVTVTDPNATIQRKSVKPPKVYSEDILPVAGVLKDTLVVDYGLIESIWKAHGWGQNAQGYSLVMPVLNAYGGVRGHVTRTFDSPKRCYTWKASAQPWLDWWISVGDEGPIVLVEDCLSACRLFGLGFSAVALLGTSISIAQAKEIRDIAGGRQVYIALDNDAFVKSLDLVRRHAHIVTMVPVLLQEDVKNMQDDEDIRELFRGRA